MVSDMISVCNTMTFFSKRLQIACTKCGEEISLDDCFKDKAAENELKTATIKCTNQECPWEGPSKFYKVQMPGHEQRLIIHCMQLDLYELLKRNTGVGSMLITSKHPLCC